MKRLVKWLYCVCLVCVLFYSGALLAEQFTLANETDRSVSCIGEIFVGKDILSYYECGLASVRLFLLDCFERVKNLISDNRSFFGK